LDHFKLMATSDACILICRHLGSSYPSTRRSFTSRSIAAFFAGYALIVKK
jgi:hypothetical protein